MEIRACEAGKEPIFFCAVTEIFLRSKWYLGVRRMSLAHEQETLVVLGE